MVAAGPLAWLGDCRLRLAPASKDSGIGALAI